MDNKKYTLSDAVNDAAKVYLFNSLVSKASPYALALTKMDIEKAKKINKTIKKMFDPNIGLIGSGIISAGKKVYEKIKGKKASEIIDELYKVAKITVPSKEEAKRETKKNPDNLPKIECEQCGYKGKTDEDGRCPSCSAIGGIKPKDSESDDHEDEVYTGEPASGIDVYTADLMGRLDEF